jgi:osmotically-inducible protein OsmY
MQNRKTDKEIKQQVLRELKWDSRITWAGIGVDVTDGVVTLSGTVTSYANKTAAQQAAHRVNGVLDVVNEIQVRPSVELSRRDTELAKAVRHALEWDALVPDERIHSTVADGWVRLEGDLDLWRERQDAERAVARLAGVVGVTNLITIRRRKVDPEALRQDIEEALERRADREAERIRIEVKDGTVDLWGRVHSWLERRAVLGSISHAPGVSEVRDHLRVDPYF